MSDAVLTTADRPMRRPPLPRGVEDPGQIDRLTEINLGDLFRSFKLDHIRRGRGLLRAIFYLPARRFARAVAEYDRRVGEHGLAEGARWILRYMSNRVQVHGAEHVPTEGPLLLLSNHPGLTDTMALFSSIPRGDLRIIAAVRPFLRELPNTSRQLIEVDEADTAQRTGVLREAIAHLRAGGAVLTFPAGRIDPDPAVAPGALDALATWSPSIALFARQVPQAVILPVLVSGVISAPALRHPITRLYRSKADREWAAATLQLLLPWYRRVTVSVAFGQPLRAADLAAGGRDAVLETAKAAMHDLILTYGRPEYGAGQMT
ncbi:MAG: 1-acyl-sn-glycerol-3-phosphate acyltransferase [Anaerolineae bacterium]